MKKASEYRQHAEECRALARGAPPGPQHDQIMVMAENWERLAAQRSELIRLHPELAIHGESKEESDRDDKDKLR